MATFFQRRQIYDKPLFLKKVYEWILFSDVGIWMAQIFWQPCICTYFRMKGYINSNDSIWISQLSVKTSIWMGCFLKVRYMIGVSFKILARTPVPTLPPPPPPESPPPRDLGVYIYIYFCTDMYIQIDIREKYGKSFCCWCWFIILKIVDFWVDNNVHCIRSYHFYHFFLGINNLRWSRPAGKVAMVG